MSYDFNVKAAPCDHVQTLERYAIDPRDLRTLQWAGDTSVNMRAPINGASTVKVFIAGQLVSPEHAVYGYNLVRDDARIAEAEEVFYKIVFKRPVRLLIPLIEVTYLTKQPYCLKCAGLGQVSDLKKAVSGSLQRTTGIEKLSQRTLKFVLTSNCPFYPSFTSQLKNYVGRKFGLSITEADINQEVFRALDRLRQVQTAQKKIQTLDPGEILRDVVSVTARLDPTNPNIVRVAAVVSSYGDTVPPLSFTLRVNK